MQIEEETSNLNIKYEFFVDLCYFNEVIDKINLFRTDCLWEFFSMRRFRPEIVMALKVK
jgi:hypothetical protein